MSTTPLLRNPFADPAQPTFADLITRVIAAKSLSPTTRQNWTWALRTVARATDKKPAEVPAHPAFLREFGQLKWIPSVGPLGPVS
jgi:hypothetical protein